MSLCRRLHRDQAGVTVMEMVVVVALLSLVLVVAFEGLTSYQATTAGNAARLQNLEEARISMAVLTKDLRTATSFRAPVAAADVTFLGHLNTAANRPPNQVRLSVDGQGRLLEAVTPPDNPTANPITYTGTPVTRVVAEGLVNGGLLLDYRDTANASTTVAADVASVVITLSVDLPAPVEVPATVLTSRVSLPNIAAAGP